MTSDEIRQHLKTVLTTAQAKRPDRLEFVVDPIEGLDNPQWVLYERERMLEAVNAIRRERGKSEIDDRTLWRKAESQAQGHVDYTDKFVLHAAELAMED